MTQDQSICLRFHYSLSHWLFFRQRNMPWSRALRVSWWSRPLPISNSSSPTCRWGVLNSVLLQLNSHPLDHMFLSLNTNHMHAVFALFLRVTWTITYTGKSICPSNFVVTNITWLFSRTKNSNILHNCSTAYTSVFLCVQWLDRNVCPLASASSFSAGEDQHEDLVKHVDCFALGPT